MKTIILGILIAASAMLAGCATSVSPLPDPPQVDYVEGAR
jgi:hypothetical protein